MQIQFHPASGRGTVRTFSFEGRAERVLIAGTAGLVALTLSLWVTVPLVVSRRLREGETLVLARELEVRTAEWNRAAQLARSLRERALDLGDLLNRVAYLYGVPVVQWPRVLNPERAVLAAREPGRMAADLDLYLRGLERGRAIVADREKQDPDRQNLVPTVAPIAGAAFEPSAFFGPRTSPWTGEEEFFLGVDLAAPQGAAVVSSGGGTVAFAGVVRRVEAGSFWRLGNLVIVSHGESGATVYGHLEKIGVRRGERVERGDQLGSVGSTGWAISPQLHYEYWRPDGGKLRPTDPLFATLDRRLGRRPLSLEQMEATSAPGPFELLPGIQISADRVAGSAERRRARPQRPRRRHRI